MVGAAVVVGDVVLGVVTVTTDEAPAVVLGAVVVEVVTVTIDEAPGLPLEQLAATSDMASATAAAVQRHDSSRSVVEFATLRSESGAALIAANLSITGVIRCEEEWNPTGVVTWRTVAMNRHVGAGRARLAMFYQFGRMLSVDLNIKNLDDFVGQRLREQAAAAGMSVQQYLRNELTRVASRRADHRPNSRRAANR